MPWAEVEARKGKTGWSLKPNLRNHSKHMSRYSFHLIHFIIIPAGKMVKIKTFILSPRKEKGPRNTGKFW